MEEKSYTVTLLLLVGFVAVCYLLRYFSAPESAPNEPPVLSHPIPYVGHLIGLLRHGLAYFEATSMRSKSPIYTLHVLNGKIYVVTSPDLVNAVSRNSTSIAFNPFIAQLGKRLTGIDEATMKIVCDNLNGETGHWGLVLESHDDTIAAMTPGESLDHMSRTMLQQATDHLRALEQDADGTIINLYAWIKHVLTLCSTRAIYGPKNSFSVEPGLEEMFWDLDRDINLLLVNIFPRIVAPKGYRAREKLASAFKQYFDNDPRGRSSGLTNARYNAHTKYGVTSVNMGRLEVGTLIGILVNTVPSLFYMLVHIYCDEALLRELRNELEACISTGLDKTACQPMRYLDVHAMKTKCPLFHSVFHEVLRVHSLGATSRLVLKDTTLNDTYLLKAGSIVQMPTSVIHSDPTTWGANAKSFNPGRFLKQDPTGKEPKRSPAAAFRPWGGGSTLCPGRHFASTEIMSLAAMLVLRFDILPVKGQWVVPPPYQVSMATAVFPPKNDIPVRVVRRPGVGDGAWEFAIN